jgi:hypothetical protein
MGLMCFDRKALLHRRGCMYCIIQRESLNDDEINFYLDLIQL